MTQRGHALLPGGPLPKGGAPTTYRPRRPGPDPPTLPPHLNPPTQMSFPTRRNPPRPTPPRRLHPPHRREPPPAPPTPKGTPAVVDRWPQQIRTLTQQAV